MTLAICIRCGAQKLGALTPCHACRFDPTTVEDRALALNLSDHYLSEEELEEASKQIAAGQPFTPPRSNVAALQTMLNEAGDLRMPIGCRVFVWALVAVMILLVIAVVVLLTVW